MDYRRDPIIDNPGPQKWFNTDAFRVLTPFTPRTNPYQFDGITGPIFWNLDGTVSKTFPIQERYKLEFRFEAYNLTNSLMWANPNMTIGNSAVRPVHRAGDHEPRTRDAVHAASGVLTIAF